MKELRQQTINVIKKYALPMLKIKTINENNIMEIEDIIDCKISGLVTLVETDDFSNNYANTLLLEQLDNASDEIHENTNIDYEHLNHCLQLD
ncbi:MAG: hypothetical protein RR348_03340 [Clostridia bacterium]